MMSIKWMRFSLQVIGVGSALFVGVYIYLGWWQWVTLQALIALMALEFLYLIRKEQP